jgi:hypothetical protein
MLTGIFTRPKLMAPFHKTFNARTPFHQLGISFDILDKIMRKLTTAFKPRALVKTGK